MFTDPPERRPRATRVVDDEKATWPRFAQHAWAFCGRCRWSGPFRETSDEAQTDGRGHTCRA